MPDNDYNFDEIDQEPELWDVFAAQKFIEPKWRIEGLIPDQGIVMLAGSSGDGKSWIGMDMARSLAFGTDYLGQFSTEKSTVLYINQEMAKSELHRRGQLLGFENNLGRIWVMNKDMFNLDEDENAEWLIDFVIEHKIEVIFIDTFRAVAGKTKDDDAKDVIQFLQKLKPLNNKGIVTIFLDHLRKPERFDGKTPKREHLFGSQYKVGGAEILIMIKKNQVGEISLYQLKNRLGKEAKPFKIVMEEFTNEDTKLRVAFRYLGQFEEKDSKKDEAKEFILDVLHTGAKSRPELLEVLLKERNIGEKNTSEALRELRNEGLVHVKEKSRPHMYFLPDKEEENSNKLI